MSERAAGVVNRVDMVGQLDFDRWLTGDGSVFAALRSAGLVAGAPQRSQFHLQRGNMAASGDTAISGWRPVDGDFQVAPPGDYYTVDLDTRDLGLPHQVDMQQERHRLQMQRDPVAAEQSYFMRSFVKFVEQLEILAVVDNLGNVTSPFDAVDRADTAAAAMSGSWADDGSNPIADWLTYRAQMKDDGVDIDTMYMGESVLIRLLQHAAMVQMFGGTPGVGVLSEQQVISAFPGLRRIYTCRDAYIGEFVTMCRQAEPGDAFAAPENYTLIYGYGDQGEEAQDAYGITYSMEHIGATFGRVRRYGAWAHCGLALNQFNGRRITNVLA